MGVSELVKTRPSFKRQSLIQVLYTYSIWQDSDSRNAVPI